MFSSDAIYVQIFANRFVAQNIDSGVVQETQGDLQFSSPRMLVADFAAAQHLLKKLVKSVRCGFRSPKILMHPMVQFEDGFTLLEYRLFMELAYGSGASRARVHTGSPLSGEDVRKAIRDYKSH